MVKVHRYIGLTLALFLLTIALTGSVIAFYDELERVVNTQLRVVQPRPGGWTARDVVEIRNSLEAQDPKSHVFSLQFPQHADQSLFSRVTGAIDPATGQPYPLDYNEVFADPYSGERLGERFFGHFSFQPEDLISQIYFLHYAFILPESAGIIFMAVLALVWALDSIVGLYLTLPVGGAKKGNGKQKSYLERWKPAWQIKRGAATNRVIYDTHRATGLWVWPALLLFAVTGFVLDQPGLYARLLASVSDYQHLQEAPPRQPLAHPLVKPPVDWLQALDLGQRYMVEQGRKQGFAVGRPAALEYRRDLGLYFYSSHTSRDLRDGETPTESNSPATAATLALDARNGAFLAIQLPTGQSRANTITSWMIALHVTALFGLPWQIAVSVFGLVVATITMTGVLIWWRKRRSRLPRGRSDSRNRTTGPLASAPAQ